MYILYDNMLLFFQYLFKHTIMLKYASLKETHLEQDKRFLVDLSFRLNIYLFNLLYHGNA